MNNNSILECHITANNNQNGTIQTGCLLRSFTFFQRSNRNWRVNPMFYKHKAVCFSMWHNNRTSFITPVTISRNPNSIKNNSANFYLLFWQILNPSHQPFDLQLTNEASCLVWASTRDWCKNFTPEA